MCQTLPLHALKRDEPLHAVEANVVLYPNAGVAFVDGSPVSTVQLAELYLALTKAVTCIHAQKHPEQGWATPLGVVDVKDDALNIVINSEQYSPATVDVYTTELRELLEHTSHSV